MGKLIKILVIVILFIMCISIFTCQVQAEGIDNIIQKADKFVEDGKANQTGTVDTSALKTGINELYSMIMAVGAAIALIVGVIVGIKVMTSSTGEEKAKYKKVLIVYIVGCVVIFGSYGIWKLVIDTINGAI